MDGTVEDLPVANPSATLDERRVKALEDQASAMARSAAAAETFAAQGGATPTPTPVSARGARFERVLCACLYARTSTTVEGFLSFARELCDGLDREFPPA